jgi:hypothetical protein
LKFRYRIGKRHPFSHDPFSHPQKCTQGT